MHLKKKKKMQSWCFISYLTV